MKKHNEKMTMEQLMADYKFDEREFDFDVIGECEVSDMEKQKILKSTLEKAGVVKAEQAEQQGHDEQKVEKFARRRLPLRKAWALGLVAVMVFAMGGIAVAKVAMDDGFVDFLQPASEEQASNLNAVGADVTQEVTDNGVTVRSRQMVGDGHRLYLLMDVIAPEGTVLDAENDTFGQPFGYVDGNDGLGYSFERLADDNPGDNKISMILSLDGSEDIVGHDLHLDLTDLKRYSSAKQDYETLFTGNWKLTVPINYTNQAEKHEIGKTIAYKGGELVFEDMEISPLSLNVNVSGSIIKQIDKNLAGAESGELPEDTFMGLDDYENLKITLKDGNVVNMRGAGSSGSHGEMTINYEFEKMIELDNIQSISFDGNEIYSAK